MTGRPVIRPIRPTRERTCPRRTAPWPSSKQRSISARRCLTRSTGWPMAATAPAPDAAGRFRREARSTSGGGALRRVPVQGRPVAPLRPPGAAGPGEPPGWRLTGAADPDAAGPREALCRADGRAEWLWTDPACGRPGSVGLPRSAAPGVRQPLASVHDQMDADRLVRIGSEFSPHEMARARPRHGQERVQQSWATVRSAAGSR